jgi:hypothetical protein
MTGGGGEGGEGDVLASLLSAKEEKRITAAFFRIIGNMLEAFGYFESSLGLQSAFGHSFAPPTLPHAGKIQSVISRK